MTEERKIEKMTDVIKGTPKVRVTDMWIDVLLMYEKFGFPQPTEPGLLDSDRFKHRRDFLEEELQEFVTAHEEGRLGDAADGLVDLVVVALGTAIEMGLPWNLNWSIVQHANMAKEPGETKRGVAMDLRKPEGWKAPDHDAMLEHWLKVLQTLREGK